MRAILLSALGAALAIICPCHTNAQTNKYLNIVFVGNSITHGAGLENPQREAPPVRAAIYLGKQPFVGTVRYSNQGVSGSTTVDFLPKTGTLFNNVLEAADQFKDEDWATLVFSLMLGTNDSAMEGPNGAPVSPKQYRENMQKIIDSLLSGYADCKVVIHRPIWYSPNTHNSSTYLKDGLKRLESYYPEIQDLVETYGKTHSGRVFLGDTEGFGYFEEHCKEFFQAEEGNSGIFYLHPNKEGAKILGELWGKAIYRAATE